MFDDLQQCFVAHNKGTATNRLKERFMVVDGHRMGAFDAIEQVSVVIGQQQTTSVGRIDMHPNAILVGKISDVAQGINISKICGAGGTDNGNGDIAEGDFGFNGRF
ncbi:hypothetical protein D3C71_1183250 [compost metagenome]